MGRGIGNVKQAVTVDTLAADRLIGCGAVSPFPGDHDKRRGFRIDGLVRCSSSSNDNGGAAY